jgi:ABC-type Fe3+-hydroxamate transport system substrate-binding protein
VTLARPAQRIVSLVPSTTETLFDLGVGDRVVGVTRFCVHPDEARRRPKIGGTKDALPERIRALAPELVVANCEENTREIFDALRDVAPVWAAFPRTLDDAIADLGSVAALVGADAGSICAAIEAERRNLARQPFAFTYLVWKEPWMAVGTDTFLSAMLAEVGGVNECRGPERFPTLSLDELAARDGLVLLSSEPFPFAERHATALGEAGVRRERIRFVDGELLSWHGTRLRLGLPYLRAFAASVRAQS